MDFDLVEVLIALGGRALEATWRAREVQYMSKDEHDIAAMETIIHGRGLTGRDLVSGIEQLLQVIDGEFAATDSASEAPWVIVRAVDSTWWEVVSGDPAVQKAIRARFRVIEEHEIDTA